MADILTHSKFISDLQLKINDSPQFLVNREFCAWIVAVGNCLKEHEESFEQLHKLINSMLTLCDRLQSRISELEEWDE